jgi:hypothetical protein
MDDIAHLRMPDNLHLGLWLDEQERYFEGIECWLLADKAAREFCVFE